MFKLVVCWMFWEDDMKSRAIDKSVCGLFSVAAHGGGKASEKEN